MAEGWDAIVIGAGISGLGVGVILARDGKKVLVLEREKAVGGRASTRDLKIGKTEWRLDVGTFHSMTMGNKGAVGVIYELGPGLEELKLQPLQAGMLIYRDGRWQDILELNKGQDRDEFKRLVDEISKLSYREIEDFDTVSFREWVFQRTQRRNVRDFYRAVGFVLISFPDYDEMSAGEALYAMRINMETMRSLSSGSFVSGGSINLFKPLAKYIESRGGKVQTGVRVHEIVVEDGRVKGVKLEVEREPIELWGKEVPDLQFIEAPIVVSSMPIWSLFNFVSEEKFPSWFARLVKSYTSPYVLTSIAVGRKFALNQAIYKDTNHRVAFDLPHSGLSQQGAIVTAIDPTIAPQGKELVTTANFGKHLDIPTVADKWRLERVFQALSLDLKEMYPEIKKENVLWEVRSVLVGADGLGRVPYFTGRFRVHHRSPIEGLYVTGDTVQTRGCGVDAAARSGILCANAILKTDYPTLRVEGK